MQYYLLLCRSVTHAQRINAALKRMGISGRIIRPPLGLSERGCGYAVRIGATQPDAVVAQLRAMQLAPEQVYHVGSDGKYREILQH